MKARYRYSFLLLTLFFGISFTSFVQAADSDITVENIFTLTNEGRLQAQISPLVLNEILSEAAQNKAKDMIEKGYFAHDTPNGEAPWVWVERVQYPYRFAGENLAIHFTSSQEIYDAWMSSPSHRKNLTHPGFKEVGIGVEHGLWQGKNTTVVVQFFGTTVNDAPLALTKSEILSGEGVENSASSSLLARVNEKREQILSSVLSKKVSLFMDTWMTLIIALLGIVFLVNAGIVLFVFFYWTQKGKRSKRAKSK